MTPTGSTEAISTDSLQGHIGLRAMAWRSGAITSDNKTTTGEAMKRGTSSVWSMGIVNLVGVVAVLGCGPDVPKECGANVKRVTSMDFSGPTVIPSNPGYSGYDVTISVEKNDDAAPARVCYAVRDDDPWTKLFWSVDDVLDAYFMDIPARETTKTLPGQFVLDIEHGEVCGWGAIPGSGKVKACSGESEAEVYLETIGSSGPNSPTHDIRVQ